MNLAQRMTTPGIEAIYGLVVVDNLLNGDVEKIKQSLRDNAESRPWINLYSLDMCRPDVPSIIQGPVRSVVFEEHILRSEGNAWYLLLYQMTSGA